MIAPDRPQLDVASLSPAAARVVDPKTPAPLRQLAAKGVAPGVKPPEALAIVVLLASSEDFAVAETARRTLDALPPPLVAGAITRDLHAAAIDALAPRYARDASMMERLLALPQIHPATVAAAAEVASEAVCELIATNEQRLLETPAIIERLYMNKATRMSTADRVLELAVRNRVELSGIPAFREASAAIVNELIALPQAEPTPDDVLFAEAEAIAQAIALDPGTSDAFQLDEETGEERVDATHVPLYAQLAQMTVSQKIRRAMVGTASDRMILVRDQNKLIAQAAARSPHIQESEIAQISASRSVSDDVLRIIATDREWTRSHTIKWNLVSNPRTPFVFAARLIQHLREHELKALARSKNVTGAVATAARQQLQRRGK